MTRFEGEVFRLGTVMIFPAFSKSSIESANPDLSPSPVSENDWPARRAEGCPAWDMRENLPPEGASTPDGVGCRIGRGYSVFARKGKPPSDARGDAVSSEARRVGNECDRTGRTRRSPYH